MPKAPTLYEAIQAFMGPLVGEYGTLIERGETQPDLPVKIMLGGYTHETTLGALWGLDRAYQAAFEQKQAAAVRKSKGTLL